MSDDVLVTRDGAIVTLTFNRPEARNALTWAMYERLTYTSADFHEGVRAFLDKRTPRWTGR